MPLLKMKNIDRVLMSLNENVHGVFFEDAEKKSSHPFNRWARSFDRMKPLTVYERGSEPLSYTTYKRDEGILAIETLLISDLLRQGVVVLFPLDDWFEVSRDLAKSSPDLRKHLERHIDSWSRL